MCVKRFFLLTATHKLFESSVLFFQLSSQMYCHHFFGSHGSCTVCRYHRSVVVLCVVRSSSEGAEACEIDSCVLSYVQTDYFTLIHVTNSFIGHSD